MRDSDLWIRGSGFLRNIQASGTLLNSHNYIKKLVITWYSWHTGLSLHLLNNNRPHSTHCNLIMKCDFSPSFFFEKKTGCITPSMRFELSALLEINKTFKPEGKISNISSVTLLLETQQYLYTLYCTLCCGDFTKLDGIHQQKAAL